MEPIKVSYENFPRTCGEVIAKILKSLYKDTQVNYSTDFEFEIDYPTDEIRKTLKYNIPQFIYKEGKPYSVIDIAPQLSMGFNMSFDNKKKGNNNRALVAICMQFYHEKILFAKADWACPVNQNDQAHDHPQPHWHFEFTSKKPGEVESSGNVKEGDNDKSLSEHIDESTKQPSIQDMFDEKPEVKEEPEQEKEDNDADPFAVLERMHFAMITDWHKDNPSINPEMTKESVHNWIRNCIISVINEHKTRNKVASAIA